MSTQKMADFFGEDLLKKLGKDEREIEKILYEPQKEHIPCIVVKNTPKKLSIKKQVLQKNLEKSKKEERFQATNLIVDSNIKKQSTKRKKKKDMRKYKSIVEDTPYKPTITLGDGKYSKVVNSLKNSNPITTPSKTIPLVPLKIFPSENEEDVLHTK